MLQGNGRLRVTLRGKWAFAFAAAVLYLIAVGFLAARQHQHFLATIHELEAIHSVEERLTKVNASVAYAILDLQELYHSRNPAAAYPRLVLSLEAILAGLQQLNAAYPTVQPGITSLEVRIDARREDSSAPALLELRTELYELVERLDGITRGVRERRAYLSRSYRLIYDEVMMTSIIGGLVGILLFGGVITLFLTRLTWDIGKLEARALSIVKGYRGEALPLTRHDEIGRLMQSVNGMQTALRVREQQLEVTRQQRFHHEKMAAIGSLASAVGHEINNPISAIQGVAQSMQVAQMNGDCPGAAQCRPELILEQTRRIAQITRQLSEITAPPSPEPQLLDLNALLRKVCSFVRYDRRMRNVELAVELDSQLPAVRCIGDHVTQIVMNVLLNAADATEGITGRKPRVSVRTAAAEKEVHIVIADNGCGMDPTTAARAFDEAFTTKPAGKGSGLGLFISKSLIEQCGGRICLNSEQGRGTEISVSLPLGQKSTG